MNVCKLHLNHQPLLFSFYLRDSVCVNKKMQGCFLNKKSGTPGKREIRLDMGGSIVFELSDKFADKNTYFISLYTKLTVTYKFYDP